MTGGEVATVSAGAPVEVFDDSVVGGARVSADVVAVVVIDSSSDVPE
jgi:hypothetical protein